MRFERIDDKTVRCFLSMEELEEYEITYKDFIFRSEKAMEVMQDIIEQAAEEVDYKPPKLAMDIQIMMVPDQGMVLTFSEKDLTQTKDMLDCLKEVKSFLDQKLGLGKAPGHLAGAGGTGDRGKGQQSASSGSESQGRKGLSSQGEGALAEENHAGKTRMSDCAVFVFRSLGDICRYARILPDGISMESAVYREGLEYYLFLKQKDAAYEQFSRACIRAMEYGVLHSADLARYLFIREQGECLIAEDAVEKLRGVIRDKQ